MLVCVVKCTLYFAREKEKAVSRDGDGGKQGEKRKEGRKEVNKQEEKREKQDCKRAGLTDLADCGEETDLSSPRGMTSEFRLTDFHCHRHRH